MLGGCSPQHPAAGGRCIIDTHERGATKYMGHKKRSMQPPEWLQDPDTPRGPSKAGALQTCPAKTFARWVVRAHVAGQESLSSSLPALGDADVTVPPALLSSLLGGILGCSGIRRPSARQMCPLPAVACPCFPATALVPALEKVLQLLQLPLLPKSSHGNTGKGFYF